MIGWSQAKEAHQLTEEFPEELSPEQKKKIQGWREELVFKARRDQHFILAIFQALSDIAKFADDVLDDDKLDDQPIWVFGGPGNA